MALPASAPVPAAAGRPDCFGPGDWPAVEQACAKLTKAEPNNGRAWFRLGRARQSQGRFESAVEAYLQAEGIGHNPNVMVSLSAAYAKLGRQEDALKWLEAAAAAGFSEPAVVRRDESFAGLAGNPRFEASLAKIDTASRPCASLPEARQFDFWVGKWEVRTPQEDLAGMNEVQLLLGDCVLLENWTGQRGSSGKSINLYNQYKGFWQQTWVDDQGDVTEFVDGVYKDGVMRFRAETRGRDGKAVQRRLSFTNLAPGKVRQYSEQSTDGGKTWTTEYDLTYTRVGEASTGPVPAAGSMSQ
jgi:hypothetical protein